ncbi:MAG: MipA/OmpV family protein [Verrucomicrobiota bacterium]
MKYITTSVFIIFAIHSAFADTSENPFGPWYMEDYEDKRWRVDGLIGSGVEPTYPGSDENENEITGLVRLMIKDNWNNRYAIYPLGVSGSFDLTENLNFLVQLEYEAGGDGESADFEGLDEIDDTIDGNFALSYRWGNAYLFGSLQPDVLGRGKGLVWFAGGGYDWRLTENLAIRSRLGLTGGNNTYMDTEFNITAGESERTGLREYDPGAGIKNIEFPIQIEYKMNKHWSLYSLAQIEHYLGDAADSPLIKVIGNKTTVTAVAGIFFRW